MVPKFILKNARLCAKMIQQGRKNVAYKIPLINCDTFRKILHWHMQLILREIIQWEKFDQFMAHIMPKLWPKFAPYFSHPVFQVSVV